MCIILYLEEFSFLPWGIEIIIYLINFKTFTKNWKCYHNNSLSLVENHMRPPLTLLTRLRSHLMPSKQKYVPLVGLSSVYFSLWNNNSDISDRRYTFHSFQEIQSAMKKLQEAQAQHAQVQSVCVFDLLIVLFYLQRVL